MSKNKCLLGLCDGLQEIDDLDRVPVLTGNTSFLYGQSFTVLTSLIILVLWADSM